jgi:hypothetical protein
MTEDLEDERNKLNKSEPEINRGVELLLLRNRRRRPEKPKTFQVKFGKMVSLFRREIVHSPELLPGHQEKINSLEKENVSSNSHHRHS